jgi:DNA-binding transcriptional ArsR family regulator
MLDNKLIYIAKQNPPIPMRAVNWQVAISPRFELFLALWSVVGEKAARHGAWRRQARARLGGEFWRAHDALGGCAELWILFFDAAGPRPPESDLPQLLAAIRRRPAEDLVQSLLAALLHSASMAERLTAGKLTLAQALAALPRRKREWLGFMGLYPYEDGRPMARAVARMLADPPAFAANALAALEIFVRDVFAAAWRRLRPQLAKAARRARASLALGDWPAIGRALGLNIEFDMAHRRMRALRGGYALPFAELGTAYFLPSAFNELQFWTVLEGPSGLSDPLIPFLDPEARLTIERPRRAAHPSRDMALVFRALGDATRFAMAGLLARRPMSSAELGRQLGLSKPTVAHHVHELRQAGLLLEQGDGRAVILALDRAAMAGISGAAVAQLFDGAAAPRLARSRRPA